MHGHICPWIFRNQRQPQQDTYIFDSETPVYLGGNPGTERVVVFTTPSRTKTLAQIQRYDGTTQKWVVEYQKEVDDLPYLMVLSGYWELVQRNVVVLYSIAGSGGFLSYTVVGKENGQMKEYVHRSEIFQGSVWFEGGRLVEGYGIRARVWRKRGGSLVLEPFSIPQLPGAHLIEFSIAPDGKVSIPKKQYTVSAGSTVQIIRTDLNTITERMLVGYTPIYKYIPQRNAIVLKEKGKVEYTIIPGGYDWDKSVNVTVEAV